MANAGGSSEENERLIAALATDHAAAELDDADRAMLDYAARLTLDPGGEHGAAVDGLKARGFDDRAIHDICAVTAYYAFVNRIADGLGVELEDEGG
ncbi:MAG: peroxidase [Gemmatimonadetes bacterium]|nr:peroxidase [Gemmatimonadota bacterium]